MALNFPNAPANGQVYTAEGTSWVFRDPPGVWIQAQAGFPTIVRTWSERAYTWATGWVQNETPYEQEVSVWGSRSSTTSTNYFLEVADTSGGANLVQVQFDAGGNNDNGYEMSATVPPGRWWRATRSNTIGGDPSVRVLSFDLAATFAGPPPNNSATFNFESRFLGSDPNPMIGFADDEFGVPTVNFGRQTSLGSSDKVIELAPGARVTGLLENFGLAAWVVARGNHTGRNIILTVQEGPVVPAPLTLTNASYDAVENETQWSLFDLSNAHPWRSVFVAGTTARISIQFTS